MGLQLELNNNHHFSLDFGPKGQMLSLRSSLPAIKVITIKIGTTAYWNNQPLLIPSRGEVFVYSDYSKSETGQDIPGLKFADGSAYLIDTPFIGGGVPGSVMDLINEHIQNGSIHVSETDRGLWNNKVSCQLEGENLILKSGMGDNNG